VLSVVSCVLCILYIAVCCGLCVARCVLSSLYGAFGVACCALCIVYCVLWIVCRALCVVYCALCMVCYACVWVHVCYALCIDNIVPPTPSHPHVMPNGGNDACPGVPWW